MKLCFHLNKSSDEINKLFAEKKNRRMKNAFSAAKHSERVVFVPHCMRNIEKCIAHEKGSHYVCMECGACKISEISKSSRKLGYMGLFILKGGKAVDKLVSELKPKAIVGVACFFEGTQGIKAGEKHKLSVQFVPLTKDGCVNTDVELSEVLKTLEA
jgi:hypothetical protein